MRHGRSGVARSGDKLLCVKEKTLSHLQELAMKPAEDKDSSLSSKYLEEFTTPSLSPVSWGPSAEEDVQIQRLE